MGTSLQAMPKFQVPPESNDKSDGDGSINSKMEELCKLSYKV